MGESRLRRAARSLADPWSLLAASVGAGAAWALSLPVVGIGVVGVGMLGVAAAAGALQAGRNDDAARPAEPVLVQGTVQYRSVSALESYLADLTRLQAGPMTALLAAQAADAVQAATSARSVAVTVAGSVDQLDSALVRATEVAQQMTARDPVIALVRRMHDRREELLAKLATAVDGVGEVYARLLELSATSAGLGSDSIAGPDPVAEVNLSLDAIRQAFAELDTAAQGTSARLSVPGDRHQPPSF